ncbi:hypothetical protein O0550_01505 [Brevibacillus halotolerans]|uniref:hypothetical protein n=1 Tax=Brevibacillus TaxID=55080 RepID=UPI00215CEDC6|nr:MULTISPECIES: hypothetical protein [Brevibacillus]MCR8961889.1 hypothetical protein [Brevibacillus laterosporus]MCZ0834044.1 hypothetical protein [Brevibacillus halotolerans]
MSLELIGLIVWIQPNWTMANAQLLWYQGQEKSEKEADNLFEFIKQQLELTD